MTKLIDLSPVISPLEAKIEALSAQVAYLEQRVAELSRPIEEALNFGSWMEDWNSVRINNWLVESAPWGTSGQPQSSYQRIAGATINNGVAAKAEWNVAHSPGFPEVKGFPNIQIGQKPGRPTTDSRFPDQLRYVNTAFGMAVKDQSVDGMGHMAWNIWLSPERTAANSWNSAKISGEILVQAFRWGDYSNPHERYPGGRDPRTKLFEGTLSGARVSVYKTSSGAGGTVPLFLVIPQDGNEIKTLDLGMLVSLLRAEINVNHFLCDVECGVEMMSGSGSITWSLYER